MTASVIVAGRTPAGDLVLHVPPAAEADVLALLDPPVICSGGLRLVSTLELPA